MTLCTVYYRSTVEDELILADLTEQQKGAVERMVADLRAEVTELEAAINSREHLDNLDKARNEGYESGYKDGKMTGEQVARAEIKKAFETFRQFAGF